MATVPSTVLVVPGIWDDARAMQPLARRLARAGHVPRVLALHPSDGSVPIEALAQQLDGVAAGVKGPLDVVGFSMGALVCRYWLQRLGGRERAGRFVSISGPHRGTLQARWPTRKAGIRQMRPGSALLRDLGSDRAPFGDVEVTSLWSPFDLMILPARSALLPTGRRRAYPVPWHHQMILDPRVQRGVAVALRGRALIGRPEPRGRRRTARQPPPPSPSRFAGRLVSRV